MNVAITKYKFPRSPLRMQLLSNRNSNYFVINFGCFYNYLFSKQFFETKNADIAACEKKIKTTQPIVALSVPPASSVVQVG